MSSRTRPAPALAVSCAAVVLALAALAGTGTGGGARGTEATPAAAVAPGGGTEMAAGSWKEVDRLAGEDKYEEASRVAEGLLARARQRKDDAEWTRALVRLTQLRIGLHGYETAVRRLREEPWPSSPVSRAELRLLYGHALVTYQRAYSWEIGRREKVETTATVDLKSWTREQILAEARKAYQEVWSDREALGALPPARFRDVLEVGSYPAGIRGTLRDSVSYLYADLLADSAGWTPEESNGVYRLDLAALLRPGVASTVADLAAPGVHPLTALSAVLDDLEAWHAREGKRGAALEARLERSRRLWAAFTEADDRAKVRADLEERLAGFRSDPWWAAGQAQVARFRMQEGTPGARAAAHAAAAAGEKAYPGSVGGNLCRSIVEEIEAPEYRLQAMTVDGPGKRSIEVTHRNLPALHLRAYPYDVEARITRARDWSLLPAQAEMQALLASGKPAASWTVSLPATPDYELHRTFVTPPLPDPGFYLVLASPRADFAATDNSVVGVGFLRSDLVLVSQPMEAGTGVEVRVLSGATGRPLGGAEVSLWRYDWQTGHRKVETRKTGADGFARLADAETGGSHFLLARLGREAGFDLSGMSFYQRSREGMRTASLVYTDRSVYRPDQKLFWKVLAYRGSAEEGTYAVWPEAPLTVWLVDANGEKVATQQAKTGSFGTAAGELVVPSGRVLGGWRVESSLGGAAGVRVEEYKRPTFEASFVDPKEPLRLNRKATLTGEARYYFGLPVVNGTVRWSVTRETVYPWWWWLWGGGGGGRAETVAAGTSSLGADGKFDVAFTPQADERLAAGSRELTYRYRVSADVTDEGGETRSASRSFRLGFVAVEARIDWSAGFFAPGGTGEVRVSRSTLDGAPSAGSGRYRLLELKQPAETPLPADLPPAGPRAATADRERTPGDALRPRWDTAYEVEAVLRGWADGAEKASGELKHGADGVARIPIGPLAPGAYRIRYTTTDAFGAAYETSRELVVAGAAPRLALPAVLSAEESSARPGETVHVLAWSGLPGQAMLFERYRGGHLVDRRELEAGKGPALLEVPVTEDDRGGFSLRLTVVRDHQLLQQSANVLVPWDDKELAVSFATFRDRIRPGAKETWRVTVKAPGGKPVEAGAAELLAYMYDRSLDVFAPHTPPDPRRLYPSRVGLPWTRGGLGAQQASWVLGQFRSPAAPPVLTPDELRVLDSYGIGGPGVRGRMLRKSAMALAPGGARTMVADSAPAPPPAAAPAARAASAEAAVAAREEANQVLAGGARGPAAEPEAPVALRSDFSETAFWKPQLLTGPDGSATIEFTVPDSVTSWNVWVHAVTRDLRAGSLHRETRSVKELMVRPHLPRFFREGDVAELKVVVNDAGETPLRGEVRLDVVDPATGESLLGAFGLTAATASRPFEVAAGGGANVTFPVTAPRRVGTVAFKVTAVAGDLSDGELRPVPVLPSRLRLVESRFVTLRPGQTKRMSFPDMAKDDDPTRTTEQLVVTVDAQLFYTVLQALPYLVDYPYECTEQTLNRFLSTGIVSSLYGQYPAVARMAQELSKRTTPLETFDRVDPNRKMELEESPWLVEARGGKDAGSGLTNVLDPRIAKAEREASLARLRKAQTSIGAFPWWPGGPPSPYMTLYILHGFARAAEFGVEVPKDVVQKGWQYLAGYYRSDLKAWMAKDCCWEMLTFLNYVASAYPDPSWVGDALTPAERKEILAFSFKHWRQHSPYLKGYLALTLKRMGRPKDAALVWSSVMDSSKTTEEQGTFWAPEERSWLWYNDTVETQAFALRTLTELAPADPRREGLVQWLLLDKKLNQWKSTKATAEVVYALAHFLKQEGALGAREAVTVTVGPEKVTFSFDPDRYTGKSNQVVVPGDKVDPKTSSTVVVEKEGKGLAFASAAWRYATDRLPAEGKGDFFHVSRRYFKRENTGKEWVLRPLADGEALRPGDQVEVQLSLRTKHEAEYVHLRDPRGAGFEPESQVSRWRWDLGLAYYEEVRDSGENIFFEALPVGEYTFRYRLRATTAGTFRVGPATVQSMYAPEFNAFSAGAVLTVKGD